MLNPKRFFLPLSALLLFSVPILAVAGQPSDNASDWTGWHVGIEIGTNENTYDGFGSSSTFSQTLEAGYDYQVGSSVIIGAEAFSDWNNDSNHSVNSMGGVSADFGSRAYGVQGLIGIPVEDVMPYVKVGYGNVALSGDFSGSDNSMRYGIGLVWRLDDNSGLLVQYIYQKASIPNSQGNGDFRNSNFTVGYDWFF